MVSDNARPQDLPERLRQAKERDWRVTKESNEVRDEFRCATHVRCPSCGARHPDVRQRTGMGHTLSTSMRHRLDALR